MPRKKITTESVEEIKGADVVETKPEVSQELLQSLLSKIESLEKKDNQNQEQIKMLLEVSDKGRMFNYQSTRAEKKPMIVKLSRWNGGVVVGWRTIKDILVKHPTTGLIVGEEQEYEVIVSKDGVEETHKVLGYPAFSDLRYNERIEAEVLGKKEDWNGNTTFQVRTPEGQTLELDSRFVN